MDLDLIKTFLEVYQERHFGRAAENLFITPSAVSARIRLLEEQLGVALFLRTRNNIQLTPAGNRLLNHAKNLLKGWDRARLDVIAEEQSTPQLRVAGVADLWERLLLPGLERLRRQEPGLTLRLDSLRATEIVRRLQQNQADLGVMLEAEVGPELGLHELGSLPLVLVSSDEGVELEVIDAGRHILVERCASFMSRQAALFSDTAPPCCIVSDDRIALSLLGSIGGSAYLPEWLVADRLRQRQLYRVEAAPLIQLPIYAIYPLWSDQLPLIEKLLLHLGGGE